MLLADETQLTEPQCHKVGRILASKPASADGMLIDVSALTDMEPESICLSVLGHMDKHGKFVGAKACFITPDGRHHWRR